MTTPINPGDKVAMILSIIRTYGDLNSPDAVHALQNIGLTPQSATALLQQNTISGTPVKEGVPPTTVTQPSRTSLLDRITGVNQIPGIPQKAPGGSGGGGILDVLENILGNSVWGGLTKPEAQSEITQAGKNIATNILRPQASDAKRVGWGDATGVGSAISGVGDALNQAVGERGWGGNNNQAARTGTGSALADMGIDLTGGGGGNATSPLQDIKLPQFEGAPPLPPQYNFQLNDFGNKANDMTAAAYSPQYQAIKEAQDNVKKNYQVANQIVSGLYDQLTGDIGDNTDKLQQQYQAAQDANNARVQSTQQNIGNTYSNSQQQITNLIKQLGGGAETAAAVLPQSADDQAYYQSQAALSGQDNNNYLAANQQATNDYQTAQKQAQQTMGTVAQEGLLRDKNNALSDWDQQRLGVSSQQAQQALQLAQQMQGQDLNLQQLNYGVLQDQYNNQLNGTQFTNQQLQQMYQNQLGLAGAQADASNAAAQTGLQQAELELKARQMAHDMQLDYDKLNEQQKEALLQAATTRYGIDVNANLTQQQIDARAAADADANKIAIAKANTPSKPTDPGQIWDQQVINIAGDPNSKNYVEPSVLKSIVMTTAQKYLMTAANGADFAEKTVQDAIQQNLNNPNQTPLDTDKVRNAALAYYASVYGKTQAPR